MTSKRMIYAAAGVCGALIGACSNDTSGPTQMGICDASLNVRPPIPADCQIQVEGSVYVAEMFVFSGVLGMAGPVFETPVLMAVDDVNQVGGIDGACLGVIRCDTRLDLATGASAASTILTELARVPEVGAVIGPATTTEAQQLNASYGAAAIPVLTGSAGAAVITEDGGYFFRGIGNSAAGGALLAELVYGRRAENRTGKIAIVHMSDTFAQIWSGAFQGRFGGLDPEREIEVRAFQYNIADPNFASATMAMVAEYGADQIILISQTEDGLALVRSALTANYRPAHWYGLNPAFSQYFVDRISLPPEDFANRFTSLVSAGGDPSIHTPWATRFSEAWGTPPYGQQPQYYDVTCMAALAMSLADSPTDRASIRAHVADSLDVGPQVTSCAAGIEGIREGMTQLDYEGVSGDMNLNDNGDVTGRFQVFEFPGGVQQVTACFTETGGPC